VGGKESKSQLVIGVLALQGDFEAHRAAVERAGALATPVRTGQELGTIDGLIIPGGESTTMLKLLDYENLFEPLRCFGAEKSIFGTCAGAILLASEVVNPAQASLGLMDMTVQRNGYGRQIDSRIAEIDLPQSGNAEAVFIRAPIIRRVGREANVLATYQDAPVLVEQGRHLAATFHPELSSNGNPIHKLFVDKVKAHTRAAASLD
jgi:5'-phosphate synthase pdxT subunit